MQYIIKTLNENGEVVYFHSSGCTVYCPELATKYKTRKNALSIKSYLINEKHYQNIEIEEFTPELIDIAHQTHHEKGEQFVKQVLDNMDKSDKS